MRLSVPLLTLAGTVAGTAAAVVAYQATAAGAPATTPVSATTDDSAPTSTSWLPCDRGWKVEGTTCVRVKEKVVVVHDLPAQAATPARSAGIRSSSFGSESADDDDANEVEHAEDEAEDQADDEADDQSGEDSEHAAEDESGHEDVGGDD